MNSQAAAVVEQLQEIARRRRPDDHVLPEFLGRYFAELPDDDVDAERADEAYAAAVSHLALGKQRLPGQTLVKILSPTLERDGWRSDRSVLMFVTDDVPFLVDTVRLVLDRRGRGIHLLIHPMLDVERDADGQLVALAERSVRGASSTSPDTDIDTGGETGGRASGVGGPAGRALTEAWTMVEIDRCLSADAELLRTEVAEAIAAVGRIVADFEPMSDRLHELSADNELLRWVADPHFVYLGAATYDRTVADDGTATLTFHEGTGLGELCASGSIDPTVIDPPALPDQRADDGSLQAVPVSFARSERDSTIHRSARQMCVSVRPTPDVEHRFFGLLGSGVYRDSVFSIPEIGGRASEVLALTGAAAASHTGRAVKHVIDSLPRDLLFEIDRDALARIVIDIVGLQERRIVRVFDVAEPVGPWTTVFAFLPRIRYQSGLPEAVERLVAEHYGGATRDVHVLLSSSSLVRISMSVRAAERADLEQLAVAIDRTTRSWDERAANALVAALGQVEGRRVWAALESGVSPEFQAAVEPELAVPDLLKVAVLAGATTSAAALESSRGNGTIRTSMGHDLDGDEHSWRLKVAHRGEQSRLADLVPLLNHLDLPAVEQHPYEFVVPTVDGSRSRVHLYDLGVVLPVGEPPSELLDEAQAAFADLLVGTVERDDLNKLILAAGLDRRQVAVLRCYARYLQQAGFGFGFGQRFIADSLRRQPALAAALAAWFDARFSPEHETAEPPARAAVDAAIDAIESIDDDRIGRAFASLIAATVRTSGAAATYVHGGEVAIKLLPQQIDWLERPRPMFEIFVCSPLVEGTHLRGGPVARGGLRWSDRPADFRTEVLGLVKAQMVKNSVIVPEGAKGGFVIKGSTADRSDRDAVRAEGVDRYQRFVGALLALTDNLVRTDEGQHVVTPDGLVVHDGEDPYLVVAADKGTATFSDIANELSAQRGFWLGDAFASGGSQGYDHKEMGITARGAWESVRRHARVLGLDADADEMTVVGIGDMSGDVFGNGMLLSPHLKIVAAFDHRHVFFDPDPDPAAAFAERQRLFELPRSSWADYDASLLSAGGGVYPRSMKSIPVTAEVAAVLGIEPGEMHPDELLSTVLRAPVDLLWNGGIGTFVKSSSESHADVGDRANDGIRVNAGELRCRMIGEGGNLGLTQLARAEYALAGGLVYTDAIDNSAGVDCSDHEVNIKILLNRLVADGEMTMAQRNALLEQMTDEVAELVLANNRAQTLALMIARRQGLPMANVHARYLDALAASGELDRALEFLPSDREMAERQSIGSGLRAPEMAVMMAYTKNLGFADLVASNVPDDPALERDLAAYFPKVIASTWPDAVAEHRLRREIIATAVINEMVNHAGISFGHRMIEDSGAPMPDVVRAYVAARTVLDTTAAWKRVDQLGASVPLAVHLDVFLDARRTVERSTVWLLRHRPAPLDIGATVELFRPGLEVLGASIEAVAPGRVAASVEALTAERIEAGVPEDLARDSARWRWLHTGFDIVELAEAQQVSVATAAEVYWAVFEALDVGWLWDGVGALPRSDRWQTQARSSLRDDLMVVLADLAHLVIGTADGSVEHWLELHAEQVRRALDIHTEIRRAESFDLTTLSVGLRQLRNLALRTRASR